MPALRLFVLLIVTAAAFLTSIALSVLFTAAALILIGIENTSRMIARPFRRS